MTFLKKGRGDEGMETGTPLPVEWQAGPLARVIDIAKLAATLGKADRPSQFAMNMIAGVPRVVFNIGV